MTHLKKFAVPVILASALLALAAFAGVKGDFAGNVASAGYGGDKITICHKTGSEKNPYVEITVDKNGLNGHKKHEGDIIPAPAGGCPKGEKDKDKGEKQEKDDKDKKDKAEKNENNGKGGKHND